MSLRAPSNDRRGLSHRVRTTAKAPRRFEGQHPGGRSPELRRLDLPDGTTSLVVSDPDDASQNQYGDPKRRANQHTMNGPASGTIARFRRFYEPLALFPGAINAHLVDSTTRRRGQNIARHIGILVQVKVNVHQFCRQTETKSQRNRSKSLRSSATARSCAADRDREAPRPSAVPGTRESFVRDLRQG